MSFNRNQHNWQQYFQIYGDPGGPSDTFTLENVKLIGNLSSMYPVRAGGIRPTIHLNNVDYGSSPYAIVTGHATAKAADLYINSLRRPGYSTDYYWDDNFNIYQNVHGSSSSYGTSQYTLDGDSWPCGYTP